MDRYGRHERSFVAPGDTQTLTTRLTTVRAAAANQKKKRPTAAASAMPTVGTNPRRRTTEAALAVLHFGLVGGAAEKGHGFERKRFLQEAEERHLSPEANDHDACHRLE